MRWLRVARQSDNGHLASDALVSSDGIPDDLLAAALADVEAGQTPQQALSRYGERAAELAPLLETAYALRVSRWPTMSMAGRVAGRERMQAALVAQQRRKGGLIAPVWRQVGVGLALALMAGATFLASPYSPLDFRRNAGNTTPTPLAPAILAPVPIGPSATAVLAQPTPSATASATPTVRSTLRRALTAEPTETIERLVLKAVTSTIPSPSSTAPATMRRPSRTAPVAAFATARSTVVDSATATSAGVVATEPPTLVPDTVAPPTQPPTIALTPTHPPTQPPLATATLPPATFAPRPTQPPAPTATATPPAPVATSTPASTRTNAGTPRPTTAVPPTVAPASPTIAASATPEPTETRVIYHTPRPIFTIVVSRTRQVGGDGAPGPQSLPVIENRPVRPAAAQEQRRPAPPSQPPQPPAQPVKPGKRRP